VELNLGKEQCEVVAISKGTIRSDSTRDSRLVIQICSGKVYMGWWT